MGPLAGVKVLEIAALGPAPFASMMLADMGAEVLRIDRAERVVSGEHGGPPPLDRITSYNVCYTKLLRAPDRIVLRLLHLAEELACISGERLHVTALAIRVERVECE